MKELYQLLFTMYFEKALRCTSDESYIHYLETRQKQAVKKQEEVVETKRAQDAADAKKLDAQAQEVLNRAGTDRPSEP